MRRMTMFWGCSIPARFPFIEKATRPASRDKLGLPALPENGIDELKSILAATEAEK